MTRRCELTGKSVLSGNLVSHSNRKTRRRYLPNLQSLRLYSESLQVFVELRISTNALRTIDKKGGLDAFLKDTKDLHLSQNALTLKKRIQKSTTASETSN